MFDIHDRKSHAQILEIIKNIKSMGLEKGTTPT